MTPTLIDQLKLAIQVESGEVPRDEIESRHLAGSLRNHGWCPVINSRHVWNFNDYEYRRKPKPLECWVNTYKDGSSSSFERKCDAVDSADEDHNRCVIERVAVHMREVIE